jgi:hypothetical protein
MLIPLAIAAIFFSTDMLLSVYRNGAQPGRYAGVVSKNLQTGELTQKVPRVGLCADCQHMRQIKSDRGSIFYMCELSATDPNFPKYPRLPVLRCSGYQRSTP